MTADHFPRTDRLILRPWRDSDREPFARMCADREVMRFFPAVLSRFETDAMIDRAVAKHARDGFCVSPIELAANGEFLGFVGLSRPGYARPLPFDPCVEIGWRLKRSAWGRGYAGEAARAWLRFGFETIGLDEIVAFTLPENSPSRTLMQRIGMTRDADGDFLHPSLAPDHPMAPHVLYRLSSEDWQRGHAD